MEIGIVPRYKVPITSLSWKKKEKIKKVTKGERKRGKGGLDKIDTTLLLPLSIFHTLFSHYFLSLPSPVPFPLASFSLLHKIKRHKLPFLYSLYIFFYCALLAPCCLSRLRSFLSVFSSSWINSIFNFSSKSGIVKGTKGAHTRPNGLWSQSKTQCA